MKLKHNVTGEVIEVMNGTLYAKSAWSKVGADKKPAAENSKETVTKATPPKRTVKRSKPSKTTKKKSAAKSTAKSGEATAKEAEDQSQPAK